ncbi:hypothetical protein [Phytohabitans rumicis]|uniref:PH domain-containing protein n=1 Tax=Phytohabitans rumicis TaxID=1076125 RepID=A0A6V8LH90_9ACTN|nr:hypothetical protein [Phytohabitans rumicis]GFJ94231.1 hypothetical protein Prum_078730 [Phytohabitans rumicis]
METTQRPSLARRAMAYESAMWRSFFRWILRRDTTPPPGVQAFGYVGVVRPILMAFIVLSGVEIPIFDLIISRLVPWEWVRWTVLGLGIYGFIWMLGLLAMLTLHPHLVDDTGIRIRNSISLDLTIPWDNIAAVNGRYRSLASSKGVQIEHDDSGPIVNLAAAGQTNVDITLREPAALPLPKGPSEPTTRVRIYADQPDAFVASVRERVLR